jgi:F0F1-type ATP synthase assembly protein I
MVKTAADSNNPQDVRVIKKLDGGDKFLAFQRIGAVAGVTVTNTLLLGYIGYYLDSLYNTKPLLLIIGIVIAFPISQYMIYKILKSVISKRFPDLK